MYAARSPTLIYLYSRAATAGATIFPTSYTPFAMPATALAVCTQPLSLSKPDVGWAWYGCRAWRRTGICLIFYIWSFHIEERAVKEAARTLRFTHLIVFVSFAANIAFTLGNGLGDKPKDTCYDTADERLIQHFLKRKSVCHRPARNI